MTKSKTLRVQVVAAVTAMLLVSFMVVRTSSAAFTGSSSTSGDSIAAGTVSLTADAAGSALIDLSGLLPGYSGEYCVDVIYGGDTTPNNAVEFYGTGANGGAWLTADSTDDGTDLDDQVKVSVYEADTDCTTHGTIDSLTADVTGLLTDLSQNTLVDGVALSSLQDSSSPYTSAFSPAVGGNTDYAFYIKVEFPNDTDGSLFGGNQNHAQGDTVAGSFTWQVEGTDS